MYKTKPKFKFMSIILSLLIASSLVIGFIPSVSFANSENSASQEQTEPGHFIKNSRCVLCEHEPQVHGLKIADNFLTATSYGNRENHNLCRIEGNYYNGGWSINKKGCIDIGPDHPFLNSINKIRIGVALDECTNADINFSQFGASIPPFYQAVLQKKDGSSYVIELDAEKYPQIKNGFRIYTKDDLTGKAIFAFMDFEIDAKIRDFVTKPEIKDHFKYNGSSQKVIDASDKYTFTPIQKEGYQNAVITENGVEILHAGKYAINVKLNDDYIWYDQYGSYDKDDITLELEVEKLHPTIKCNKKLVVINPYTCGEIDMQVSECGQIKYDGFYAPNLRLVRECDTPDGLHHVSMTGYTEGTYKITARVDATNDTDAAEDTFTVVVCS